MSAGIGFASAFIVFLLGLPVHLLICALIRLEDGGPCIYRAARLGCGGKVFQMLKYRSMFVGARPIIASGLKVVTQTNDRRITKVGRVLRCGLDELPQIYNVLRGEMAWIGPRPVEPWALQYYGPVVSERLQRRPGITGLGQVLGSRDASAAEGFAIDVWSGRHGGPWLNAWILAATPLFMAGWRSVARRRLQRLRQDPEFQEILGICEAELQESARSLNP